MSISIIEFSVENFKIFKDRATFSMLSDKSDHTFTANGQNLLKTSLIYGPNASGKSTLFDAFKLLMVGIINSSNSSKGSGVPYYPHLFSQVVNRPTFFEVVFSLGDSLYRYNFSLLKEEIITENLYGISTAGTEKQYLSRKGGVIKLFDELKSSEDVKNKTRKEVLFLSAASQWNNQLAMKIDDGFRNINVISGPDSSSYAGYTLGLLDDSNQKKKIIKLLQKADFCVEDIVVETIQIPEIIQKKMKVLDQENKVPTTANAIFFVHAKFDSDGEKVGTEKINISDESDGTEKFFHILGPIVDTLEKGKILFIDEFDNSLHPLLTKFIIDLFEKHNPNNAQLVVTTHDTSLLSYKDEFIKDLFWFTEKDKFGAGSIFSLAEFDSTLRNDTEYSKKYLEGRFGALPFIDFE